MLQRVWRSSLLSAATRPSFVRLYAQQPPLGSAVSFIDNLIPEDTTPSSDTPAERTTPPSPTPAPKEPAASGEVDLTHPPSPPKDGYPPRQPPPQPSEQNPMKAQPTSQLSEKLATKEYVLHCKSSRNNTIATLTHENGKTLAWFSGGSCGFKKGNRSSYEAGYQCAVRSFEALQQHAAQQTKQVELKLIFKGFGQGRDALHRALMTTEGEAIRPLVSYIVDRTPIKIGGTRAKKARRL
ncbi:hypothetical protein HGRIS_009599 [Hohenbuehelia grisea]|uniref:Translational machinery component n=1 Tax=Hohenbuehelia grisea TaxID=104357 RepID=A0ABR3J1M8_9AGAR